MSATPISSACAAWALLSLTIAAAAAAAEPGLTRVSYIAGGSVYVEVGRRDGLAEGDTLESVSEGETVARLVVRYLSSGRAVCDTLRALRMPMVGESVRYRVRRDRLAGPSVEPAAPATSGVTPRADSMLAGAAQAPRADRLRGRIGARYMGMESGGATGYAQPALDVRLDGTNVGGAPIDLAVDVRGHRTLHRTAGTADEGEARVYRLAAVLHDVTGRRRLTVGRQLSSAFAGVSLFDGALVEYAGERWGAGLFSGALPDPSTWVSGDILQHGGFITWRGREGAGRWSVTSGGVASFDRGQVNRQYAFFQGSWLAPRLALFVTEEVDLNTGWKRGAGEPMVTPTSTFVSTRGEITRRISVSAGYDNRRAVRLYRDRITPETEFDDRHRQGAWVSLAAGLVEHLRVSAEGRWSGGGPGGDHRLVSAGAEAYRLPALQSEARWRTTRFGGDVSEGWMHVAGLGVRPWGRTRIELNGGSRTSTDLLSGIMTRTRWEGVDIDLGLAARWYLLLSAQREQGDGIDSTQWYSSVSWMF